MCGIAGVFAPGSVVDIRSVQAMTDALRRRGPDDSGLQSLERGALVLGHRRLSILDLSSLGHQPMSSADGQAWVTYNGEIYNFREIKAELRTCGYEFQSESDTEVLLAAYRHWGIESVTRFRGMFAFALWDARRQTLHLCRDRFGVKPLYVSVNGGRLAFASEAKALNIAGYTSRTVDPVAIAEFVQYGYISAPRSSFVDVQAVRPGVVVSFDVQLRSSEWQYWSADSLFSGADVAAARAELAGLADEQLLDRVETSLTEAFKYRMVADVPVGLFLSGGIDSSLVATLLARRAGYKLKTFTIGYESAEFDETQYARAVARALGTEHVELIVSPQAAVDLVAQIVEIADEPMGDSSLIPTLMVSSLARQHVKVALSADGADELFGGYARYAYCGDFARQSGFVRALYRLSAEVLDHLPGNLIRFGYAVASAGGPRFAGINDKLRKFVRMARTDDVFCAYEAAVSEWSAAETSALLVKGSRFGEARTAFERLQAEPREQFMHFDATRYLPGDLLAKVDRASMYVSLEAREPFLDHEMARLAGALPMSWKIRQRQNKYVLRRLLHRHYPKGMFDRPKKGFSAPVGDWLRGPLRQMLQDELSEGRVRRTGLLDPSVVAQNVDRFLASGREASAAGIWTLLQLQQWAGRWLVAPGSESGYSTVKTSDCFAAAKSA